MKARPALICRWFEVATWKGWAQGYQMDVGANEPWEKPVAWKKGREHSTGSQTDIFIRHLNPADPLIETGDFMYSTSQLNSLTTKFPHNWYQDKKVVNSTASRVTDFKLRLVNGKPFSSLCQKCCYRCHQFTKDEPLRLHLLHPANRVCRARSHYYHPLFLNMVSGSLLTLYILPP